ncbi:phosphoenolpyruvate carboxykinase (GTP) [Pendulispora brunnea]|uniref:Phosphoenolpyruvate carboxykinase [GTP] n=1 Tax=Pendulispora brunnea TaxID=2905690 RepID=A0ABZ2JZ82_9BACT
MRNNELSAWVKEVADHTKPDAIRWCDGSMNEARSLEDRMLEDGTLVRLSEKLPASFLHRSHPTDVARAEHLTFICSEREEQCGPTNNWMSPEEAEGKVWPLFAGAMRGRTLYIVPYVMGPVGSPYSRVGVQITDSPYVVANLRLMTRMGDVAIRQLGRNGQFVKGLHSLGDLSPERRFICHFPQTKTIWSIGSGYGDNALLSKKCHALRIASVEGRDEGWLAEHMMVVGVTSPEGVKHYIAAAFPSACGKTNLAMLVPSFPGWKIETVGDDIAWMHVGDDGRLWAINPEAGFFGVAPRTSFRTNRNAMAALSRDVIFTNVAVRQDGMPWWEGLEDLPEGEVVTDWRGHPWSKASGDRAAHPNSRFTVSARQCPAVGPSFDDPRGVPISAIVFGGRRARIAPLVYEARDWTHGVYVGATLVSETTAAATGALGIPRNDPMAMLPFCGFNMGDYFAHWLRVGERLTHPPRIFHVNWFRRGDDGQLLWPGFGENIRVLKWIVERVDGTGDAHPTPIGLVPTYDAMDLRDLGIGPRRFDELVHVDTRTWQGETSWNEIFLDRFGKRLPEPLAREHRALVARLRKAAKV